jgi:hypothetical protein
MPEGHAVNKAVVDMPPVIVDKIITPKAMSENVSMTGEL